MADKNLNGFIEAVNAEVDRQIEEILSEADKKRKNMLEKAEDQALNDAYAKIRANVTDAKAKSKMAISKAEQESRRKVLIHRENMVKKIFADVESRIVEFTKSGDYEKFLVGLINNEKITPQTVIYLRPDDMKYADSLKRSIGVDCAFAADAGIKYGGLSLYDEGASVLINKTINNMLDEQKKDFGSKYKLA